MKEERSERPSKLLNVLLWLFIAVVNGLIAGILIQSFLLSD